MCNVFLKLFDKPIAKAIKEEWESGGVRNQTLAKVKSLKKEIKKMRDDAKEYSDIFGEDILNQDLLTDKPNKLKDLEVQLGTIK